MASTDENQENKLLQGGGGTLPSTSSSSKIVDNTSLSDSRNYKNVCASRPGLHVLSKDDVEEDRSVSGVLETGVLPSSSSAVGTTTTTTTIQPPVILRRDPLAIRHQYMSNLGLNLSARTLERNRRPVGKRKRYVGIKVQLKAPAEHKGSSNDEGNKSFFKAFSEWYIGSSRSSTQDEDGQEGSNTDDDDDDDDQESEYLDSLTEEEVVLTPAERSTSGSIVIAKEDEPRNVSFKEVAEMYLIPLHHEYSKRQRSAMWHTRDEFMDMVKGNLEEMYEEMDREYEAQIENEAQENQAMAEEEERQRAMAVLLANAEAIKPKNVVQLVGHPSRRTPLQIRSKYLKNLGIKHAKHIAMKKM